MFYLNKEFAENFKGADPYKMLQAMEGNIYRQVKGRKTFQFVLNGKSYFAKLHAGVGWGEIFKNLFQLKIPIIGARNEWEAIHRLQELNLATMNAVAYGERGWNPARRESFIVTEDLSNTVSLEDYCKDWKTTAPDARTRRKLIERVASIARVLHQNGVCHRDFYLCHFLFHPESEPFPKLSLIDLHRALISKKLSRRWLIKDIAGLFYSAKEIGLSQRDILRFMRHYHDKDLRGAVSGHEQFWSDVKQRAEAMFEKLGPTI
jgi:heptose I phosphotransferase